MNYGELKTAVKQYLECDETTFNTNIDTFFELAEEDIYRQVQLPDLMETATSMCFLGDRYLPLPTDFLSPYSLAVIVAGEYRMLLNKDHSFIREVYPNPDALGVPRYYAMFDDQTLLLAPTPAEAYTVEMNYFYIPPSITSGGDSMTTWLSTKAINALLFGATIQGYIYLKGDQDVIAQYREQYAQAIASLKIIAEGRDRKDSYRTSDRRIPV